MLVFELDPIRQILSENVVGNPYFNGSLEVLRPFKQIIATRLHSNELLPHIDASLWHEFIPRLYYDNKHGDYNDPERAELMLRFVSPMVLFIADLAQRSIPNSLFPHLLNVIDKPTDISYQRFMYAYLEKQLLFMGLEVFLRYNTRQDRIFGTSSAEHNLAKVSMFLRDNPDQPLNVDLDFITNPLTIYVLMLRNQK